MKIAQVAPLVESVPPRLYGGIERVVSWLTEDLVLRGHDVTLFASGDSRTKADLVPVVSKALRLDPDVRDFQPYNMLLMNEIYSRASEFEVIHFHVDLIHFPLFRGLAERTVTTLHGPLGSNELRAFYKTFSGMPLVSISEAQRASMPPVNWLATVHHGLPKDLYRPHAVAGDYLLFLGRISPEKGIEAAIDIAERLAVVLKVAAKVDKADLEYFEGVVRPRLASRHVEFVGEVTDAEKNVLLGGAKALLFPIAWPEPFGIVMIEAMACGTPVVAFNHGSVPEVIEQGVTGMIVRDREEAVAAVHAAGALDREVIRKRFEQRFTVEQMTPKYLEVYARLLEFQQEAIAAA